MPIYEYVCQQCGKVTDVLQKLSDPPPAKCEACGAQGPLSKVVSRSSFVLKGGGWYSDLYASTSAKKDAASGSAAGSTKETSSTSTGTASATTSSTSASTASTSSSSGGSGEKK